MKTPASWSLYPVVGRQTVNSLKYINDAQGEKSKAEEGTGCRWEKVA